ncbi:putative fatty acyl-CoA reductase CG5065 [Chelonus insularis]|uniref:putative fatty acyl-CoA reductase CG5065 n=1 Tax=Chelonus insularis TaxID=460826 RepID=UPI00158DCA12|nr:putative fatty acyl-CoA reductase CG5065 [Chelonus insularis]XP_034946198.1 putative fatty acyl-CoA reductase CG5065 [Chelonus insularis]
MTMESKSPTIAEWFRNRHVLITGATGFMGKVLVSKLLSSCPDIEKIYLLVREKKGIDPQTRLQSIVQQEPFRALREQKPERLKKLVVIPGDVTVEGLDLSEANKECLLQKVSVVFHGAANVKFDTPLKDAINMNTRGTANIIALAKQMNKLQALIHISTSYSQCGEDVLEERAYPTPISPENVMTLVNIVNDDLLNSITPKLLGVQPNTYAFSKALAEDLVNRSNLPVGVARPSIVVASWKEPAPGWVESMNGPTGLMIGAAKGVIRSVLCDPNLLIDAIPCDIAVNAIIALAWRVGLESPSKPIFMNVTESGENPMTWGDSLKYGRKHALANPFSGILWYPRGGMTTNKYIHYISVFLLHLLPAYFIDGICLMTGNKPFLVKIQNRVNWGLRLVQYYTMKPWVFLNDGMKDLREKLDPADKETFFMDTKAYDWDQFMKIYVLGARRYVLKEDPATLPQSRRIFMIYWIADGILRFALVALFCWFLYICISPFIFSRTLVGVIEH